MSTHIRNRHFVRNNSTPAATRISSTRFLCTFLLALLVVSGLPATSHARSSRAARIAAAARHKLKASMVRRMPVRRSLGSTRVPRSLARRSSGERRPTALLLEGVAPEAKQLLTERGFKVKATQRALKGRKLRKAVRGVTVLGIRSGTQVTPAVLDAAPRLRAIGAFSVGTNNVSVPAASARGIPVFNAPTSSTRSVAELTIGQIMMLARRLGDRSLLMRLGRWKKDSNSIEVRDKTLGIVGYGNIGSAVAGLAASLGMRVLYYDVADKAPKGDHTRVDSLDELLRQSRFVTLHVPGTPQTADMIGAEQIALMPKGSYLINNSRGNVVQVPAVKAALKRGHLAGAALDVHPGEPKKPSSWYRSRIRFLRNVVLTSHVGGATEEGQRRIAEHVAERLTDFFETGEPKGAVNAASLDDNAGRQGVDR
jgi:D-3-phosphoglycerate dehydrogenase